MWVPLHGTDGIAAERTASAISGVLERGLDILDTLDTHGSHSIPIPKLTFTM
jgi:hypothetical protein